uniref:Uncharacterized protein n=1 Tax=Ciona savignyi TaxID=51511 RepID=H2Y600_CIOSA
LVNAFSTYLFSITSSLKIHAAARTVCDVITAIVHNNTKYGTTFMFSLI